MLGMYYNAVAGLAYGKMKKEPTFAFTFLLPLPATSAALAEAAALSSASAAAAGLGGAPTLSQALSCDLLLRVAGLADLGAVLFAPTLADKLDASPREAFMGALREMRAERGLPDVKEIQLEGVPPDAPVPDDQARPGAVVASSLESPPSLTQYSDVVLGGTFDHLHIGHKILLSVAALLSTQSLVIGLTADTMLQHKKYLHELESWPARLHSVLGFLSLVAPGLAVDIVPLHDMYGPSGDRPNLRALVVSEETVAGGPKVNEKRRDNHLEPLDIIVVKLAKQADGQPQAPALAPSAVDTKISSTTLRQWDAEKAARQRVYLTAQWEGLCGALRINGSAAAATMFSQLCTRYSEPHRAYHTLDHVEALLRLLSKYRARLARPEEVALAIWFHDAIYETHSAGASSGNAGSGAAAPPSRPAGSNERDSDALFRSFAEKAGLPSDTVSRVSDMILATIRHQLPAGGAEGDLPYFLDFDLCVLSAGEAAYARYSAAIRREYIHLPYDLYLRGRLAVLRSFAQRESLYFTRAFREQHEARARFNLRKEMERIQQAPELQQ